MKEYWQVTSKGLHVCGWNKLAKKDFIINNIFFQKGVLYEDVLWCYQLCKKAKSYAQIPTVTYLYLLSPGSIITKNNDSKHAKKQFASFVELFNLMVKEFHYPQDKELKMQYS